jgi:apolipoprotein N-acyltransferase
MNVLPLAGFSGAAFLWLGFPNDLLHLPLLAPAYPAALACLGARARCAATAFRHGWLTGIVGGSAVLYWLALPVHDVGGLPWPLAVPCAVFIAACLACLHGLFSLGAHTLKEWSPVFFATLLGLAWYLLEEISDLVLGFPWLSLAGALAAWPVTIQAADIVGAYMLSGIWTLAVLLCLCPMANASSRATGLGLAVLLLCYGAAQLQSRPFDPDPTGKNSFSVLFVEGNIDQNNKWTPEFQRQTVEKYINLTQMFLSTHPEEKPLIVWPETALPFFFEKSALFAPLLRATAAQAGCPLLFGAPALRKKPDGKATVFNRAWLLGDTGTTLGAYDKEHLVPFGEYLPEWLKLDFLSALLQGVGLYESGTQTAPLRYGGLVLGMLICYEGIFPSLAKARVEEGANILADISNDNWFGRTPAARQHLSLTVLRAVEQNRWLLRGTNSGITAIVDPRGRLALQGEQFTEATRLGRAEYITEQSLYHTISPWLLPTAVLAGLALAVYGRRRFKTQDR